MATRTIQLLGQGYGATPAQITVTANGNTVYSGPVNTVNEPVPLLPNTQLSLQNILCTVEIDQAFVGQMPMTCAVSSGTLIFAEIFANYVAIPNPVYTQAQEDTLYNPATSQADKVTIYTQVANPPLSQIDIETLLNPATTPDQIDTILTAHNCMPTIGSGPDTYATIDQTDARSSVSIDGIPQTPDHGLLPGTWWWNISTGSNMSYLLDVTPAKV